MLKYVRVAVATQMLAKACFGMSATQKFIHNTRSEIEWDRILNTEHAANFERRES